MSLTGAVTGLGGDKEDKPRAGRAQNGYTLTDLGKESTAR